MGIKAILSALFGTAQTTAPCLPLLNTNRNPSGRATKKELAQMVAQYYFGMNAQVIDNRTSIDDIKSVGCYIKIDPSGQSRSEPFGEGVNYHLWVLSFDGSDFIQLAISYEGIRFRSTERSVYGTWQTITVTD